MIPAANFVAYWDASAVLSALFHDQHSQVASAWAHTPGIHLLSSLGWAEVHAVISRIQRERVLTEVLVQAAKDVLESGPWRLLNIDPRSDIIEKTAAKWPLRGAGLWHLAACLNLHDQLPELILLTFDSRLHAAAAGEGVGFAGILPATE